MDAKSPEPSYYGPQPQGPYQAQQPHQTQPAAQPVPQAVQMAPTAMQPNHTQPEGEWKASLWDCCSPFEDCLVAWCLPCLRAW
jgi:hypothetical protein